MTRTTEQPPPPFDIHHHAIPPRMLPYIERAMAIDFVGPEAVRWHAMPSGCFGLALFLGDPREEAEREISSFDCTFAGILPRALCVWRDRPSAWLGVTLTPLAAAHLPMDAFDFDSTPVAYCDELLGTAQAKTLRESVRSAATLEGKLLAFLHWVEAHVLDRRHPNGRRASIAEAAMQMRLTDGPAVDDAAQRAGVTRRQFERDFRRYLGTSPKRYAQVAKVQQVAQLAWQGLGLADIAADLGFADQAHMTRTVSEIAGMPPAALLRRAVESDFARAMRPWWNGRITSL